VKRTLGVVLPALVVGASCTYLEHVGSLDAGPTSCSKDTDCKGSRICVSGFCVDPPSGDSGAVDGGLSYGGCVFDNIPQSTCLPSSCCDAKTVAACNGNTYEMFCINDYACLCTVDGGETMQFSPANVCTDAGDFPPLALCNFFGEGLGPGRFACGGGPFLDVCDSAREFCTTGCPDSGSFCTPSPSACPGVPSCDCFLDAGTSICVAGIRSCEVIDGGVFVQCVPQGC